MKPQPWRVLFRRADIRLAVAAGLTTGFTTFTGLPYGYYATLALLAVASGTYGTAVGLGRQRILGSILGVLVLVLVYEGLQGLPLPVGLAVALGLQRLLGGLLNLQVGYKVGGLIIVMGWLVHSDQLTVWVPMRLFWTVFGVLIAMASLKLLWPSTALRNTWEGWAGVLSDLADQLHNAAAEAIDPDPLDGPPVRSTIPIRNKMMAVRGLRPALLDELGGPTSTHPALPLLSRIDECCSRLVGVLDGLERRHPRQAMAELSPIRIGEAALLEGLARQLETWVSGLRHHDSRPRQLLPPPPAAGLELPQAWLDAEAQLASEEVNNATLNRLRRVAGRLQLLRQAVDAMESTERQWRKA